MDWKGIIFDFFGVVCSEVAQHWYAKHESPFTYRELRDKYICPYDEGKLTALETWDALGKATGTTAEEVRDEWLSLAEIDPEMVALIQELKQRYAIGLCSNGNADFFWSIADVHSLRGLFDTIVISSEEKAIKPNPKIYEITLERMSLKPAQAVFVDDRAENLVPAEALGMQGLHFTSASELRKAFQSIGIA